MKRPGPIPDTVTVETACSIEGFMNSISMTMFDPASIVSATRTTSMDGSSHHRMHAFCFQQTSSSMTRPPASAQPSEQTAGRHSHTPNAPVPVETRVKTFSISTVVVLDTNAESILPYDAKRTQNQNLLARAAAIQRQWTSDNPSTKRTQHAPQPPSAMNITTTPCDRCANSQRSVQASDGDVGTSRNRLLVMLDFNLDDVRRAARGLGAF